MFRLLDRYLIKKFIVNLLIAVATWLIIFLVVDIIENLSKFLDKDATFSQVFMYYIYYVPYIISLTLPIAMLLSSLFTLSTLSQANEVVAQLTAGISLYRLLFPLLLLAVVISVLAGVFNETIVPEANQRRLDMKRYDIDRNIRPDEKSRSNLFRQDLANRKLSIKFYNGKTKSARSISIKTFEGSTLIERIDARTMTWKDAEWHIEDGTLRRFTDEEESIEITTFEDTVLADMRIKPKNLIELQKAPEEMGYVELDIFIAELRAIGADAKKWLVERHLKIAMPFANFIVVLLGAPLASRKRRGGIGLNFGISLMVSFIYFIIMRTGQVMGHKGSLDPVLAAWMGNLIFFALGLYSLITVRK